MIILELIRGENFRVFAEKSFGYSVATVSSISHAGFFD